MKISSLIHRPPQDLVSSRSNAFSSIAEIAQLVTRHHPTRPTMYGSLPRPTSRRAVSVEPPAVSASTQPRVLAAAISDHTTAAFSGESFDDVQQMEEALDKMFRESEDDELFLNLPDEIFKPMVGGIGRQRDRQTRFKMSHGQTHSRYLFTVSDEGT